ncbi:MAG: phosphatase family protein [Streptosporangiaceae bacterium]|jgi:membrane-associated phospholipid phosphatase|nr:phosphatase family protein [Streptosporangiaceae bacterium]
MTRSTNTPPGRIRAFHEKFVVEERYVPARTRRNFYFTAGLLALVGVVVFVVTLANVLQRDDIATIDAPIEAWLDSSRTDTVTVIMIALAIIFGPLVLPIIILIVTVTWGIIAKHIWRPLLLAGGTLTGVIIVQIVTRVVGRSRPPVNLMLFGADPTYSFPSGHVVGTADFLLILTYLIYSRRSRPWAMVVAYLVSSVIIVLLATCRVYLGYHWATDVIASISISLVILGSVIAIDTRRTVRIPGEQITGRYSIAQTDGT